MTVWAKRIISAVFAVILGFQTICSVSASETSEISVSAESAVLICADDNRIIFEKNSRSRLPMASTTKIMTCIVALENGGLSDTVKVASQAVGIEGSSLYLQKGDTLTLGDLLYALMLRSANDCAAAAAYHISGSVEAFAELMNKKAAELGMKDTHFTNPHGLQDDNHYTTAYDFALLTSYAMKNPDFAKIVSTVSYNVELNGGECHKAVVNHNRLLRIYDGACGVKTGFTKTSGRCLVSCAERAGVRLIAVTLNAPDDWNDHMRMFDRGFAEYKSVTVFEKGGLTRSFGVAGYGYVTASNNEAVSKVIKNGDSVTYRIIGPHLLFAPVEAGQMIARVEISVNEKVTDTIGLYAARGIEIPRKQSLIEKIGKFFQ